VILADTSVWIAHLRHDRADLRSLLDAGVIHCHELVIGELACGTLRRRTEILARLGRLPTVPVVSHAEAFEFLHARRLSGRGLGWIDVHLLASSVLAGARLWSLDVRLAAAADGLHIRLNRA